MPTLTPDPQLIRELAAKYRLAADTLGDAAGQINLGVNMVTYDGPFGDKFRGDTVAGTSVLAGAGELANSIADRLLREAALAEEELRRQQLLSQQAGY